MDLNRIFEGLARVGLFVEPRGGAPGRFRGETSDPGRTKLLLRALIAAANADGHLDAARRARISRGIAGSSLSDEERRLVMSELGETASMETLALEARDPALRMDVYAASVLAADQATPAGRIYLENMAEILALPPMTVRSLREQVRREGRLWCPDREPTGQDQAA